MQSTLFSMQRQSVHGHSIITFQLTKIADKTNNAIVDKNPYNIFISATESFHLGPFANKFLSARRIKNHDGVHTTKPGNAFLLFVKMAFVLFARRHLMVWAIFAPKYIFTATIVIVIDVAFLLCMMCLSSGGERDEGKKKM